MKWLLWHKKAIISIVGGALVGASALTLPSPWDAIVSAAAILVTGGTVSGVKNGPMPVKETPIEGRPI
jgi:hypothetical protein